MLRREIQTPPEYKSVQQIGLMREAGKLVARALRICREMAKPGARTSDINQVIEDHYASHNATPLFKGYIPGGMNTPFPAVTCMSLNEQVVHGIPSQRALRDGALLVVLVLIVFLMNSRAMIIALFALPLSVAATIAALSLTGQTINTMSLGGLAIAIGELVDDAIIDVENVVRRLRQNFLLPGEQRAPVLQVVYDASREIRGSVVFATLIVGIVSTLGSAIVPAIRATRVTPLEAIRDDTQAAEKPSQRRVWIARILVLVGILAIAAGAVADLTATEVAAGSGPSQGVTERVSGSSA